MYPARAVAPVTVLLAILSAGAAAPGTLRAQLSVTANAGTVRYEQAPGEQSAGQARWQGFSSQ